MQYLRQNNKKMRKMLEFAKLFKIDFSFLFVFVVAFLLDEILIYFYFAAFTVLHELSHFLIAKKLGYYPKKIHLTFFGASLEGSDDFVLEDEIKIVLAGPIFNFCVIIFCYLMFWFHPESYNFLNDILLANWSIFLFNFLPIYPLDLGRILLAIFSKKYSRKDALEKTKNISFYFLMAMFILFLITVFFEYDFSLGFVCVNLAGLVFSNGKDTSYKRQLFARKKFIRLSKGLIERTIYVKDGEKDYSLFKFIDDYHFVKFVFLDDNLNEIKTMNEVEFFRKNDLLWVFIYLYKMRKIPWQSWTLVLNY